MRRILKYLFFFLLFIALVLFALSFKTLPDTITYGVSFSKFRADELHLDWQKTYLAILDDLEVKHLRLAAHWPMIEPKQSEYNFSEMDFQMTEAEKHNASVILAVGRRLPSWPECHEPEWEKSLTSDKKKEALLQYIETVVKRYKNSKALTTWQVENEPYLGFFGQDACGTFDESLFHEEIALVRKLDPSRQILVTDSGETGYWAGSYKAGDIFGSTMYLYTWSKKLGPINYPITPAFFRIRQNISALLFGKKPIILAELGAEPWLIHPILEVPIETQLTRMNLDRFNEILTFASKTGFSDQYLWGAEWWYYMKENGHPEFWERSKEIFK